MCSTGGALLSGGGLLALAGGDAPWWAAQACKCKCLYWRREWGDVPKAITEAAAVKEPGKHKPRATASAKPQAPAKK